MTQKPKKPNKKYTSANPKLAEGMREIRRSNAAGTHDDRPTRERSRKDALNAAVRRSRDESEG
jgi:hypothetical protein